MSAQFWIPIPEDALPGQYRVRDVLCTWDGTLVKVVARSTSMPLVRPLTWWERLRS